MFPNARKNGLIVEEVEDDLIVYDIYKDRIHNLNSTTALVWKNCDGATPIISIGRVLRSYVGDAVSEDAVLAALGVLRKAQLLDELPAEVTTISRREAIRKFTLASVAAILVPAVVTMGMPPLAAHATAIHAACPATVGGCAAQGGCMSGVCGGSNVCYCV